MTTLGPFGSVPRMAKSPLKKCLIVYVNGGGIVPRTLLARRYNPEVANAAKVQNCLVLFSAGEGFPHRGAYPDAPLPHFPPPCRDARRGPSQPKHPGRKGTPTQRSCPNPPSPLHP